MSIALSADPFEGTVPTKIIRRLLPFLWLLFIVNYLDRTNLAMAKLQMAGDVHLTEFSYGLGAGLFFIGYFIFEVPSNLILHRVGARRWISRIMISWGILSAAMMFTRGPISFSLLRLALGIAEAGFFPGIVFYLTHWVPARHRARFLAVFLTATAVSGLVGNPLAGVLMKLNGAGGFYGWQWLFLLEGLPAVLLGFAILAFPLLPDDPAKARWLSEPEREWLGQQLALDGTHEDVEHVSDLRHAARDSRLWLLSALYFSLVMGLYGYIYWLPTILKSFSPGATDAHVGVLSTGPYSVAVVSMAWLGHVADRTGKRRTVVCVCALIGAAGILGVAAANSAALGMAALLVAAVGIFGTLGPFWTIPTRYLRGTAAAGGIAVVNSVGALSGFVAPFAIGWAKSATGHFTAGLLVVAASLAAGAVIVRLIPPSADGEGTSKTCGFPVVDVVADQGGNYQ